LIIWLGPILPAEGRNNFVLKTHCFPQQKGNNRLLLAYFILSHDFLLIKNHVTMVFFIKARKLFIGWFTYLHISNVRGHGIKLYEEEICVDIQLFGGSSSLSQTDKIWNWDGRKLQCSIEHKWGRAQFRKPYKNQQYAKRASAVFKNESKLSS
jgi:hypothetical protein